MSVDTMRHQSVFSPYLFGDRRVDIVGCGATGSRIAMSIAKLGITNIHLWDDDSIEEHNIANQLFGNNHIGNSKVFTLAELIGEATGTAPFVHYCKHDGTQELGNIVFLLTDTMLSRKEIWDSAIKYKIGTQLMVETRMSSDNGRIYAVNPNKLSHVTKWEETLCDDSEAIEASACGATLSIGSTAEIISGLAVWNLIRWFSIENGVEDELENEIIFSTRPVMTISRKF